MLARVCFRKPATLSASHEDLPRSFNMALYLGGRFSDGELITLKSKGGETGLAVDLSVCLFVFTGLPPDGGRLTTSHQ